MDEKTEREMDAIRDAGNDFVSWCDDNGYGDVARPWLDYEHVDRVRYDEAMRLFAAQYDWSELTP